jgi:3-methylcrotonyl-CoA carboxylase beta subunit
MRLTVRTGYAAYRQSCRAKQPFHGQQPSRSIASHTYGHHAAALSVLPTNVEVSSADYTENARQMGEAMARMRELHQKIEEGGPARAREKHIARGKMLPRE